MSSLSLSNRKKDETPKDARKRYLQQLLKKEYDDKRRSDQELLQKFKDEDPRSVFYYRMLRRIGLPEIHARFAPWFFKSNQIQLNRWSSVLFVRLEQAFYTQPEALTTLEMRMREHQQQINALKEQNNCISQNDAHANAYPATKMQPRQQNQLLLQRAFRNCSFHEASQSDQKAKKTVQAQKEEEDDQEEDDEIDRLEIIPEVPLGNAPPGFAPPVRGQLESHGKHIYFTYNGRWKSGEMHGGPGLIGVYSFADGGKYRGEWRNSAPNGAGRVAYPNGVKYTGAFVDGKFHGYGVLELKSRFRYEGNFHKGERNGHGKLMFLQTETSYEGEFYKNMRHGKGTETNSLGYVYTGHWYENRMVGPGTLVCPDKSEVFKAKWPNCVLGEAIRLVKRELLDAANQEEAWYRKLLRVRDDLRALDLQYAHWEKEDARMTREEEERVANLKKIRREKREAQAAAKQAFMDKAQHESDGEEEESDSAEEDDNEEEEEEEDEEEEEEEEEEETEENMVKG